MDSLIASVKEVAYGLASIPFDPNVRFAAVYIVATIAIAVAIWLWRGRPVGLVRWLFPREVYRHRQNWIDIELMLTNRLVGLLGLFGPLIFTPLVAYVTLTLLTRADAALDGASVTWATMLIATFVIVTANDFCKYWVHRWHHEMPVLWPFHAVHHSAEILTPITVARIHPVEKAVQLVVVSVVVGVIQGVLLMLLAGPTPLMTIGGANVFYVAFNALGANLRHSHIWLSYGRVLEHILISPAQHQIHHSSAPEHHDKNYGSIFAVWDWMFGTLYVPDSYEDLTYGISDVDGNKIAQPHETLAAALVNPFRESWQAMRGRTEETSFVAKGGHRTGDTPPDLGRGATSAPAE